MALRFVWPLGRTARAAPAAQQAPAAEANLLRAAREDPQQLLTRLNSGADGLSSLQSQLRLTPGNPQRAAYTGGCGAVDRWRHDSGECATAAIEAIWI
jgi:hypothetical protein